MIGLKQIDGKSIDLSKNKAFVEWWNNPSTFAKYIIDEEINKGLWWDEELANLKQDSVIIDAGANVGLFALYMLPKVGKIYCIEPTPATFIALHDTLSAFTNRAEYHRQALGKEDGFISFENNSNNTTMNQISENGGLKVACSTLLSFMTSNEIRSVDLLKLDIEGSEKQVIIEDPTIEQALKLVRKVYIETHPKPWGDVDEPALIQKMKDMGFSVKNGKRGHSFYFIKD